jgi:hypothetical protein
MEGEKKRRFLRAMVVIGLNLAVAGLLDFGGTSMARANHLNNEQIKDFVTRAYIYSFPVYEMYRTRHRSVSSSENPDGTDLNRFFHRRTLSDHRHRIVTAPNNDTLYSSAWLDLSLEPVVLSVPDTGGRYYSMAFMDFYTNNFACVGRRTTGTKAGDYVVTGPKWNAATPAGLPVIKSPTNAVWLLGRTLVDDEADLPNVHKIQDGFKLTALSEWTRSGPAKGSLASSLSAPDPKDPWNYFKIVNLGLTENPPPAGESALMTEFGRIGVGPNQVFDPGRFSGDQRRIALEALEAASREIRGGLSQAGKAKQGWSYPPSHLGNYGQDYAFRAVIALIGLAALEPAEAVYMTSLTDKNGRTLTGENRYRLRFEKGAMPPVDAFWSLSMYELMPDQRSFFVDNPIHRYAIGDRTKGLKAGADGSIVIYIQHHSPGKDLESNWLPAPPGVFRLSFRAYQPKEPLLKGEYALPWVERVD